MILGDLGAEILKIEAVRGRKEVTGPYSYRGQDGYFMAVNRSKKSVTLDLRTDAGRDTFYDLVKVSDVVLDNFRPGVMERLKVDYDTLKGTNARIVSCSISGFGSDGPYRDRPAYDLVVQAISGTMSITGEPGGEPVRSGVAIGDQGAGMFAAHGILAALYARERTGTGCRVETSLLDAMVAQLAYEASLYLLSGIIPEPLGTGHRTMPFYQAFRTRDGYVAIAAIERFPNLCKAVAREDLIDDARFTEDQINDHRSEFIAVMQEVFATRTTDEWLQRLNENDVPCGPVNRFDKALSDPQVLARDMVITVDHSLGGQIKQTGNPIRISTTPPDARRHFPSPPTLGEHTTEVLSQLLGYSQEKIDRLRQEKVI